ncbi:saccharopine dehydrogenase NADP-binding domain-containing protein [bacterium]|nr:saccharopine dehydrogenase NADP-binding domain-containing protein [bacterium]
MVTLVLGAGKMGRAICHAMVRLGSTVIVVDRSLDMIDESISFCAGEISGEVVDKNLPDILDATKPDVVISSLPYFANKEASKAVIDKGINWCDLGGRVDVSEWTNNYAEKNATASVFTDLGLAPGWVNIMAEEGARQIHRQVDDVEIAVGGLPAEDTGDNPLNYKITWSVDGLINEYRDDCIALKDGEPVVVNGMDGLEQINLECSPDESVQFEKFYTSGGASHTIDSMLSKGVKNCSYKTIRYAGHCNIVKYLIFDCGLGDKELQQIFESCGVASRDVVLMTAKVKGDDVTWYKENVVFSDEKFSAMQKCTAYPISAVAYLMTQGRFDKTKHQHRDWDEPYPKVLGYSDVPYKEFLSLLNELGLEV